MRMAMVGVGLFLAAALAWAVVAQRNAAPGGPTDARTAPDLTVSLLGGGTFDLSRERGHPVLILFTASWCEPCIPEVNKMAQLEDEFAARGLRQVVVSIDPGDTPAGFDGLRQVTKGQKLLWGLDVQQRGMRAYRIQATDTKVLVDAQGRIAFTSVGPTEYQRLRAEVARALP